ncbi:hypothetical protein BH18ACT11_BH18ACT11_00100 [soil metagenome]
MKSKLIREEGGEKTFALMFDNGNEVVSEIVSFATGEVGPGARHGRQ